MQDSTADGLTRETTPEGSSLEAVAVVEAATLLGAADASTETSAAEISIRFTATEIPTHSAAAEASVQDASRARAEAPAPMFKRPPERPREEARPDESADAAPIAVPGDEIAHETPTAFPGEENDDEEPGNASFSFIESSPERPRAEGIPEAEAAAHAKRSPGDPRPADEGRPSADAAPVAKRGRGRPRKVPRPEGEQNADAGGDASPVVKRGPGRPRKHPRSEDSPDGPPAKRPRGRPRKPVPPEEAARWTAVVGRLVKGKAPLTPALLAGVNAAMDAIEERRDSLSREILEDGLLDMVALLADVEDNETYSLGALRERARALIEGWRAAPVT
ncbi:hypothetical protein AURDEDRAFT_116015 [Auricularia subglabra TFB-10046 SS5]|nr:hypothetical protein AURDEDRAFT_116015 [Auricularia subglabra TFB-10046 SS5]